MTETHNIPPAPDPFADWMPARNWLEPGQPLHKPACEGTGGAKEVDMGKQYDSMLGVKPVCPTCGGSKRRHIGNIHNAFLPGDSCGTCRAIYSEPCPDCKPAKLKG